MYQNTTMSNSFFIVSMTGLILFCIYFSMFLIQKFINCDSEPDTTDFPRKKCCEGTWKGLTGSVILVLIITGIVTIVSFGIFFFTVRYLYSAPASTTVSTVMQPLSDTYNKAAQVLEEKKAAEEAAKAEKAAKAEAGTPGAQPTSEPTSDNQKQMQTLKQQQTLQQ